MSLQDWLANGWLAEHRTNSREIADMLTAVERDLRECSIAELSAVWKLNIAYTAALRAADAALAAAGYRASREQHHYRAIQSLAFTIHAEDSLLRQFDQYRMKRNLALYDHLPTLSEHEASGMIEIARTIRDRVVAWLKNEHPELTE